MHYHTERIINQVYNNQLAYTHYNDDIQVLFGSTNGFNVAPWLPYPCSMESFQVTVPTTDVVLSLPEYLDGIFEDESQLILETHEGIDDDGGSCYQAYILMEDHVQHFYHEFRQSGDPSVSLFLFKYILDNPEAFMIIWAGPY